MKLISTLLFCLGSMVIQAQTAKIYFIRELKQSGTYRAFIDDRIVCMIDKNSFSIHEVDPGEHTLNAQWSGKDSKKRAPKTNFSFEAGKSYYFKIILQAKVISFTTADQIHLEEITERAAKELMEKLKQDDNCIK